MVNLIKNVIKAGGYKLSDIQHKVKKLYLMGDITEEEMNSLLSMASNGVSADAERPEVLTMLRTLSERMSGLEARLAVLEAVGEEEPADPDAPAEYEAWTPWDGISDRYQQGAIVTHVGKVWESVFAGQNVWEPGTAGTEAMWVEIEQ
jgi:hypothetical protein